MKIATYNINGINSRIGHLVGWLSRETPDIVCLQELKATDEDFPIAAINNVGYSAIWHGQRSWNGVAILSRGSAPIEIRRGLPGNSSDVQSRYIEAAVKGVIVGCLYLPNGNPQPGAKFDYKLEWFDRLIKHAKSLYKLPHSVVLAGDFNVVPTDFDIYDPKSWRKNALLQPASREKFARLLAQGWADALRQMHPDERIYTFWDYFRNHWQRNSGLRIDHLLLNPKAAASLMQADVDRWVRDLEKTSDHAPTWVELSEAPLKRRKTRAVSAAKQRALKKVATKKKVKSTKVRSTSRSH